MESFIIELMMEFRSQLRLNDAQFASKLMSIRADISEFVTDINDALRYTPIRADEGVIQEWIGRLDIAKAEKDYQWIVAAKRWINVAFLGASQADAHLRGEVIDFRIHTRIADAHIRLKEWAGAVEQLKLAATLSPNDILILRTLGRAQHELGETKDLVETLGRMKEIDPEIFKRDREGITLRCGSLSKLLKWNKVEELLSDADQSIVASDPYLLNWHAIATMKTKGPKESVAKFRDLAELLRQSPEKNFWDTANLVNALLAVDELDEARKVLSGLAFGTRSSDEVQSAARFYGRHPEKLRP